MFTKNMKFLHALVFLIFFSTNMAMQESFVQVCTGNECKWIPIKQIIESTKEPIKNNSKNIFLSALGFAMDHPKGILYCLSGGVSITALALFASSDYFWQTPKHAKKCRRLLNQNLKSNIKKIVTSVDTLSRQSENQILPRIEKLKNSLENLNNQMVDLEVTLKERHKKTLEEDKIQIDACEKEQSYLLEHATQVISQDTSKEVTILLENLKEKKEKITKELKDLEIQQEACTSSIFGNLKKLRSVREAFQKRSDKVDHHLIQQEHRQFANIEKEENSMLQKVETFQSKLDSLSETCETRAISTQKDLEELKKEKAELTIALFEVQKSLGMVSCNPGGFPGLN